MRLYPKTDVGYVQITYAEFAAYETQLKITKLRTGSYRYKGVLLGSSKKTPTKPSTERRNVKRYLEN